MPYELICMEVSGFADGWMQLIGELTNDIFNCVHTKSVEMVFDPFDNMEPLWHAFIAILWTSNIYSMDMLKYDKWPFMTSFMGAILW